MSLETMRPNPVWDDVAFEEEVAIFEALADDLIVKVWGGDWCKDCRAQLPDFGAALDAAGVTNITHYPVEKTDEGEKVGPHVDNYGITLIPTVVVEDAATGAELARFVESADRPIATVLADQLQDHVE